jgi:hypothetical protein
MVAVVIGTPAATASSMFKSLPNMPSMWPKTSGDADKVSVKKTTPPKQASSWFSIVWKAAFCLAVIFLLGISISLTIPSFENLFDACQWASRVTNINMPNISFSQFQLCADTKGCDCQSHKEATKECLKLNTDQTTSMVNLEGDLKMCTDNVNTLSAQNAFSAISANTTGVTCYKPPEPQKAQTVEDFLLPNRAITDTVNRCIIQMKDAMATEQTDLQKSTDKLKDTKTIFHQPMEKKVDTTNTWTWAEVITSQALETHKEEKSSNKLIQSYENLQTKLQKDGLSVNCGGETYNVSSTKDSVDWVLFETVRKYTAREFPYKALPVAWKPDDVSTYEALTETRKELATTVKETREKVQSLNPDETWTIPRIVPCRYSCKSARFVGDLLVSENMIVAGWLHDVAPGIIWFLDRYVPAGAAVSKPVVNIVTTVMPWTTVMPQIVQLPEKAEKAYEYAQSWVSGGSEKT